MKQHSIFWSLLCLAVTTWGCNSPSAPANLTSCSGSPTSLFFTGAGWLGAGTQLYSISDPFNPLPHSLYGYNNEYRGETTFVYGVNQYTVNNSSLSIDSIGSQIYPQNELLTANPRQLAFAPGYLYLLRHTTYPGSNEFCWQATDTVNELDVDRFSDTSYAATLLSKIPLVNPQDIAIKDSVLFVLDGSAGLKTFSLSDPTHPALDATSTSVQGFHLVLTDQSTLLVSTSTGLEQYDVSNPGSPLLLSKVQ